MREPIRMAILDLADAALGMKLCIIAIVKPGNGRLSTRICAFAQLIFLDGGDGFRDAAFV
jgi:hypothetical protein